MRYVKATATVALLLAITGTFAAPLPTRTHAHTQGENQVKSSHSHDAQNHPRHGHRVSLAKWIHAHLHYPHHWPFHPHHDTQSHQHYLHDAEKNEQPKSSGSMLRFWLHSHFAPHTSKLRTHRGKAILDNDQKSMSSSFDDEPSSEEDGLKARDLETRSMPEWSSEGFHSPHQPHHYAQKLHKAGYQLHKLDQMVERVGNVHDAVKELHPRIGMAAAQLGYKMRRKAGDRLMSWVEESIDHLK